MRLLTVLKQKKGFTLVELLIAITIFGVLMVAFLYLFYSALHITLRAGDRDKSVAGLSGKVEKSMASEVYTDAEVSKSPESVTIIFRPGSANPTSEPVDVERTTGKTHMKDGTEVKLDSYKTAEVP